VGIKLPREKYPLFSATAREEKRASGCLGTNQEDEGHGDLAVGDGVG
jgi:hypothetical protein